MKEINPLGSEKLTGNEKLKRILELTYYNQNNNKKSTSNAELVKESKAGGMFGIVKEKDGYYVKRGLNEQSLDYIGGIFMKNKNKFSSYSEALKRLELLKGQEELQEATKYVLKKPSAGAEVPPMEPSVSEPPMADVPAVSEPSSDDVPMAPEGESPMSPEGEAPMSPEGDVPSEPEGEDSSGESKRSDYMAEVQKFAGKLGQELRDQKEKMESDDIKYVLNMIISAVDLDKLEFEDLEEIGKKFEREEEESSEPEGEMPTEPESDEEVSSEPEGEVPSEPESEMGEMDNPMDKLESFINTPIETNELDLGPYSDIGKGESNEDVVELDMSEIQDAINKSVGETLSKYFK
jgi:hypothetical protein